MALYELEDLDIKNIKDFIISYRYTGNRQDCGNFISTTNILLEKLRTPAKRRRNGNTKTK